MFKSLVFLLPLFFVFLLLSVRVSASERNLSSATSGSESTTKNLYASNLSCEEIGFQVAQKKIEEGDFNGFVEAIKYGVSDLEMTNKDGLTLLCLAVKNNSFDIASHLLNEHHVNADTLIVQTISSDPHVVGHYTALFFAQTPEMIRLLVQNGAAVNFVNQEIDQNSQSVIKSFTNVLKAFSNSDKELFYTLMTLGASVSNSN